MAPTIYLLENHSTTHRIMHFLKKNKINVRTREVSKKASTDPDVVDAFYSRNIYSLPAMVINFITYEGCNDIEQYFNLQKKTKPTNSEDDMIHSFQMNEMKLNADETNTFHGFTRGANIELD